jgi:hypothetical protein
LNKHIGIETIEICVIYRFFREDGNSMSKYPDFMDPKCSFRMFLMSINIIPIPISIPILRISPDSSGLPAFTTCLAQGIHENHVAPDTSLPHPLQQRQGEEP